MTLRRDSACFLAARKERTAMAAPSGLPVLIAGLAGSKRAGDEPFHEVLHLIAERLVQHCDAVLRVGGESKGQGEVAN